MEKIKAIKKYIPTIIKYVFAMAFLIIVSVELRDIRYFLFGTAELFFIFSLSDVLVRKSKWFNVLNAVLVLIFNAQTLMLHFANSYVTLVMIENLSSVEDLHGKAFLYGLGILAVLAFSFLPVKNVTGDKIKWFYILPAAAALEILVLVFAHGTLTPALGLMSLGNEWKVKREMIAMKEQMLAEMAEMSGDDGWDPYAAGAERSSSEIAYSSNIKEGEKTQADNGQENGSVSGEDAVPENDSGQVSDEVGFSEVMADMDQDAAETEEESPVQEASTAAPTLELTQQMFPVGMPADKFAAAPGTNVIVIFVEGLSENVVDDSRNITPNLKALQGETVSFFNYYNHTFATYRGLQGQLYSGYSLEDMEPNSLTSVMDCLRGAGYYSAFINTEPYNSDFVSYLNAMSFDTVITDTALATGVVQDISDKDAFELLYNTAEVYGSSGTPFFLGMYSFGTHASFDSENEIYGNGGNRMLNKFYNADYQIGAFMEKFKNSPLADNTMVVITADHATYCDEDFRNTFPDYYRADMSCDEIPLLIYYKGTTGCLDAQGRNSLDLAPTILDILNIGYPETFMGDSLYRAKNERTAMDSFFWCQGKILYTGNDCVSIPEADMKSFASKNIAKYFAKK